MILCPYEQGSEEWLEIRRKRVTGTDMASLLGCEDCPTPLQIWQRKMGMSKDVYVTDAMRRGHDLEPKARNLFGDITGIPMMPACITNDVAPWLFVSLDGISLDFDSIVEIKVPLPDNVLEFIDPIPEKYYIQIQAQLLCTGLKTAFYAVYDESTDSLHIEGVNIDKELHARMLEVGERFYQCIVNKTPPPLTDRDCVTREDCHWKVALERWRDAKDAVVEAQAYEDECRQEVLKLCEDRSTEGFGYRVRKVIQKGSVDYSLIPQLKGVNVDKYRKPSIIKWTIHQSEVR